MCYVSLRVAVRPPEFAVQVTMVGPIRNAEPDGGVHATVGTIPEASVATGGV